MKIADLACGEGGAAVGLKAYFPDAEIVGVDLDPKPLERYPFEAICMDMFGVDLSPYDFVWASPPCQGYSTMRYLPWNSHKEYPLLIRPVREKLKAWGGPYIIENVMGARSYPVVEERIDPEALILCGTMFGKRFYRHRVFESNFAWLMPLHPKHRSVIFETAKVKSRSELGRLDSHIAGDKAAKWKAQQRAGLAARQQAASESGMVLGVGHSGKLSATMVVDGHSKTTMIEAARQEMGIFHMSAHGLSQAIPPCYSEYLAAFIPL